MKAVLQAGRHGLLGVALWALGPGVVRASEEEIGKPASPVVAVPLIMPADRVDPNGPPFLGVIHFDIDALGFVRQVHFVGPAPADSGRILARARRWIWQPAISPLGKPVSGQAEFRVRSDPGAQEIARPDSVLGQVLEAVSFAKIGILDDRGRRWEREINPLQLAHVFAGWLSEPRAYEGKDPWRARRPPRFDASIEFDGGRGPLRAYLSRDAAWMMVATKERLLFVPYGPIRRRIDEAFAKLLPDSTRGVRAP